MRLKTYFVVLACAVIATLILDGCAANDDTVNDVVEWETAREQGRLAISEARFDDAAAAYRLAFELAGATDDPDHFRIMSLNGLGEVYRHQGNLAEATVHYKKALELKAATTTPFNLELGRDYTNLATHLLEAGKLDEAEAANLKALEIFELHHGGEHPDVGLTLNNLGMVAWMRGDPTTAEERMGHASRILLASPLARNSDTASLLSNLAQIKLQLLKLDEAESLTRKALDIWTENHGASSLPVAHGLNSLGEILRRQERLDDALKTYRRSLEVMEHHLGSANTEVATVLNNLALVQRKQERLTEAEASYLRAAQILEEASGGQHIDLAATAFNLGRLYVAQRRFVEAEPQFKRALEIYERAAGPSHPNVAMVLRGYVEMLRSVGRHNEANPLDRRADQILSGTDS